MYRSRAWNTQQKSLPIEKFIENDNFIKSQLDKVTNENIASIACRVDRRSNGKEQITYQSSEFNTFSDYIKDYDNDSNPSFTKVFEDTDQCIFLNKVLRLSDSVIGSSTPNFDIPSYSINLFNGKYDTSINNTANSYHNNLFAEIQKLANTGKKICVLTSVSRPRQLHTVASIFWYKDKKLTCALYDPIYTSRDEKDITKNYLWALNVLYYNLKMAYRGTPINIINLSLKYCVTKEGKGLRCPQYYINAEYCTIFSLYFLFCYAKNGGPDSDEGLKKTVDDSYIVNPSELAREPCIASNKFRLVTLSFILTVLTNISIDAEILGKIKIKYKELEPSYKILEPSVLALLNEKEKRLLEKQYDDLITRATAALKGKYYMYALDGFERAKALGLGKNLNKQIGNIKEKIIKQKEEVNKEIENLSIEGSNFIKKEKYEDAIKIYNKILNLYNIIGIYTLPDEMYKEFSRAEAGSKKILMEKVRTYEAKILQSIKNAKYDEALRNIETSLSLPTHDRKGFLSDLKGKIGILQDVKKLLDMGNTAEAIKKIEGYLALPYFDNIIKDELKKLLPRDNSAPPPAGSPGSGGRRKTRRRSRNYR